MNDNTRDLSKFGYRELHEAGLILTAYKDKDKDKTRFINDGVTIEFNPNSGNVFMVDDDYNVAMMTSDGTLEDWFTCPICDHEGFLDDMEHGKDDKECQEYLEQIKR